MSEYYNKYLKYKNKYIQLKNEMDGGNKSLTPDEKYRKLKHENRMNEGALKLCTENNDDCENPDTLKYYRSLFNYNNKLQDYNSKIELYKQDYKQRSERFEEANKKYQELKPKYDDLKIKYDTCSKNNLFSWFLCTDPKTFSEYISLEKNKEKDINIRSIFTDASYIDQKFLEKPLTIKEYIETLEKPEKPSN